MKRHNTTNVKNHDYMKYCHVIAMASKRRIRREHLLQGGTEDRLSWVKHREKTPPPVNKKLNI